MIERTSVPVTNVVVTPATPARTATTLCAPITTERSATVAGTAWPTPPCWSPAETASITASSDSTSHVRNGGRSRSPRRKRAAAHARTHECSQ